MVYIPQLERGHSISPTRNMLVDVPRGKGAVHIPKTGKRLVHPPNWKGAGLDPRLQRGESISFTGKVLVHIHKWKGASPYP